MLLCLKLPKCHYPVGIFIYVAIREDGIQEGKKVKAFTVLSKEGNFKVRLWLDKRFPGGNAWNSTSIQSTIRQTKIGHTMRRSIYQA